MADAYCKVRQPHEGLRQLAEAISVTGRTQGRYYEAEMHRVRGELFLSMHDDGAAESAEMDDPDAPVHSEKTRKKKKSR